METGAQYVDRYIQEAEQVLAALDRSAMVRMIGEMFALRERGGRLFILGVGGSAANASHAVNDFRKIANIETYAPTDNVSELTARVNDDGWDTSMSEWLRGSRLGPDDAVLIFSVGGGSDTTSLNLVRAMELAKEVNARVFGIVSRDGGRTAELADEHVLIPPRIPTRLPLWQRPSRALCGIS